MLSPLLFFKFLVTPALTAFIAYAQKRWSHSVGGVISGLPVTVGPIMVFLGIEQGLPFMREAAAGALLGIVSLSAYVVTYILLARARPWYVCWLCGMGVWFFVSLAITRMPTPSFVAAGVGLLSAMLHTLFIANIPARKAPAIDKMGRWDLVVRALTTLTILLLITGFATILGPQYSGLLTSLPIQWTVLFIFTHGKFGYDALINFFRGASLGYFGLIAFLFILLFAPVENLLALFSLACVAAVFVAFYANKNKRHIFKIIAFRQSATL
jgi:hypothetical protein